MQPPLVRPEAAPAGVLRRSLRATTERTRATASPVAIVAAAMIAAAFGVLVIETGGVVASANGYAALIAWGVVSFVAAGLYWQQLRPGNPLGQILLAAGFVQALQALQGSGTPALFALGVLADAAAVLLVWYLLLSFPTGTLDRIGRWAFGAGVLFVAAAFLPWALVTNPLSGASPLGRCKGPCPDNVLQVVDRPGLTDAAHTLLYTSRVVIAIAIAAALALRLARGSRPVRAFMAPVTGIGALWLLLFAVYAVVIETHGTGGEPESGVAYGLTLARAALPFAFLLAPLEARAFAGGALERMLQRFELAPTLRARERVVARALDDPGLRLAVWLPQSRYYVDADGRRFEPVSRPDRAWTRVERGEEPAAGISHDRALEVLPELVDAAGRALLLATSVQRVADEIGRTLVDLRESRRGLLAADAAERRRVERELHGTAQQQLVAVRVGLELARERADVNAALAERLATLEHELDETLGEMRRIAAGLYTPLLEQSGLKAALRDMVRRMPQKPRLELDDVGRLHPEVEDCVYVCIGEVLASANERSGDVERLVVRLTRSGGFVRFRVGDRGRSAADVLSPGIRVGIEQRVAALDGEVERPDPGDGATILAGTLPVEPPPAALDWTEP